MTTPPNARRQGFTLVELLTVIGIISLLISILLPSLSKARDQAKKVADKAELDAVGKGLEMSQNDFNQYPDSSAGKDPIDWTQTWPATSTSVVPDANGLMTGAHWMARAMIGHDFQGIDTQGVMMQRPPNPVGTWVAPKFDDFLNPNPTTSAPGLYHERKGTYLDPKVFVRDDDPIKFPGVTPSAAGPNNRRLVVLDVYNFPVLYYRSNPRAANAFGIDSTAATKGGYNQSDNAAWTGGVATVNATTTTYKSTDFAGSGSAHGIGKFNEGGNNVPADYTGANIGNLDRNASGNDPNGSNLPYKGKTFVKYVHSENTHQSGNAAKAVNPDTFILISAGKDGVFGTDDDVNNFTGGL